MLHMGASLLFGNISAQILGAAKVTPDMQSKPTWLRKSNNRTRPSQCHWKYWGRLRWKDRTPWEIKTKAKYSIIKEIGAMSF